jgi:hypothetical protein
MQRTGDALAEFKRATVLDPANTRFAYVYDVALKSAKLKAQSSK